MRVAAESGVFGILALFAAVIFFLNQLARDWDSRDPHVRAAAGAFGLVLVWLTFGCIWFDHVATSFWWFGAAAWLSTSFNSAPIIKRIVLKSQPQTTR
jgi:hypothetical protein